MTDLLNVFCAPHRTLFRSEFGGFTGRVSRTQSAGDTYFEHQQDVHRIFITLEGKTRATIAETNREVIRRPDRPGSVTIVPAGIRRRVLLQDLDFLILDIQVSDDFLSASLDAAPDTSVPPPAAQNVQSDWLLRAGHAFKDAGLSGAPAMHMQTLALAITRYVGRAGNRLSGTRGLDPAALSRVIQLMHDRMAEDLSLTDLANEAGLGVSAFSRAMQKSLGKTPYRYLAEVRLNRACELLKSGSLSISQIAVSVGYSDQAHFTAAFTRRMGVSPARWRLETA
jgi:AraC family transcriptional regulator